MTLCCMHFGVGLPSSKQESAELPMPLARSKRKKKKKVTRSTSKKYKKSAVAPMVADMNPPVPPQMENKKMSPSVENCSDKKISTVPQNVETKLTSLPQNEMREAKRNKTDNIGENTTPSSKKKQSLLGKIASMKKQDSLLDDTEKEELETKRIEEARARAEDARVRRKKMSSKMSSVSVAFQESTIAGLNE